MCPELAGELQEGKWLPCFSVVSLLRAVAPLKLTGAAVSYGASSSGGCAAAAFVVGLWSKMFGFGRWRSLHESSAFLKCIVHYPSSRFHSEFGNGKDSKVSYFSIACVSQHVLRSAGGAAGSKAAARAAFPASPSSCLWLDVAVTACAFSGMLPSFAASTPGELRQRL